MTPQRILFWSFLVLLALPRSGRADLAVSLSSPSDLNHLAVGQSAEIDVTLTGVSSATALDFLSVAVQYDPSILKLVSVTPGPIVTDPTDFDSSGSSSGIVSVFYDDSIDGGPALSNPGIFYAFEVTRIGLPASSIEFNSSSAQSGNTFPPIDQGIALSIAPASAVPEPRSVLLMGFSTLLVAGWVSSGRRRGIRWGN